MVRRRSCAVSNHEATMRPHPSRRGESAAPQDEGEQASLRGARKAPTRNLARQHRDSGSAPSAHPGMTDKEDAGASVLMGKITGFLEIERRDRKYEPVAERVKSFREFVVPLS